MIYDCSWRCVAIYFWKRPKPSFGSEWARFISRRDHSSGLLSVSRSMNGDGRPRRRTVQSGTGSSGEFLHLEDDCSLTAGGIVFLMKYKLTS